jgi:hypothetical protein
MEFEQLLAAALAGGSGAAVWYIVRLLVGASRDPTRLGAWLPRVLAGWYIGLTEWEKARLEHEEAKQKRTKQKLAAAQPVRELPTATNVEDAGEPTEGKDKLCLQEVAAKVQ